ncbi:MAG: polymerase sigma factor FliA [Pseudonocardiales bacterium]|jgi:RNA polymerase sigma factor for flagellar operon FliA|nr:polymerase sigma factor FliA [Pseudonocardiales bacterium]MDT7566675.1 polymerase sigma factor FliA [Pseudonocardiales bacterium]MDT7606545.1 polymerase sigma factor FliA [Pseudonocardiales bacterium]MDT7624204.1 polymerase sigma factor FliA [Pseudonocardiales bacterium]MDT7631471.1 polymerase sigma factor FliA [Pseudonocardiales bacterium]
MTKLTLERESSTGERRAPCSELENAPTEPGALWGEYVRCGARDHRDRLVLHYEPLVRQVAGRVGIRLPAHVEIADLIQAGVFGLIDAIERFDPALGIRFETYAAQRIRGAILDELRAQDWVPRIIRNRARELAKVRENMEARLQRSASPAELAGELGVGPTEVRGILSQIRMISMEALDEWATARGATVTLAETLAQEDSDPVTVLEARETSRLLALSFSRLPERDHQVLWCYYVENLTLAEIGRRLGVTESRVCQLRGRAVSRLREKFAELAGTTAQLG